MSLTAHNQFFGWVHSFKLSRHNVYFNSDESVERPFPVIINEPTFQHVINNWNSADTGIAATTFILGIFASKKFSSTSHFDSIIKRRVLYKRIVNMFILAGLGFGMVNSSNRLQGYVPNGLPKKRTQDVLKYDYTSQFVSQTPWKYLFSGRSKPSN